MEHNCEFCGEVIAPGQPYMEQGVAWFERRDQGGFNMGHAIALNKHYAHSKCVDASKPGAQRRKVERGPKLVLPMGPECPCGNAEPHPPHNYEMRYCPGRPD
jgi:hypothetical protein